MGVTIEQMHRTPHGMCWQKRNSPLHLNNPLQSPPLIPPMKVVDLMVTMQSHCVVQ